MIKKNLRDQKKQMMILMILTILNLMILMILMLIIIIYTDDDWHKIPAYVSSEMQLRDPMISIGLHSQPWWLSIW